MSNFLDGRCFWWRQFFQEGCDNYNFVIELHEKFPTIIEKETDEFMEGVNNRRKRVGLAPIERRD